MEINFIAILVAALIPMLLGFIWYHPKVFGKTWMQAAGMSEEKIKTGNMPLIFGVSFVCSLILAMVMNTLAYHDAFVGGAMYYATDNMYNPDPASELGQWWAYYQNNLAASNHTFKHGAFHGFVLAGLMLALPIMTTNALFERKGFKYIAVNVGYWIVCLTLMGGIIAAWQ